MAFIVALGLLMTAIYPAAFCCSDGTLGSHTVDQKGRDIQKQLDSLTLASINNDFAFRLFKKVALNHPDKNIVFSLLGIITTLALMSLGAHGNTLEEILEGLKFNVTETSEADIHQAFGQLIQRLSQPGDQVQISTGNTLFVEKHLQILTEFKEKARSLYQTKAFTADFQQPCGARKLINDYVKKETQGKIKELVSDLDNRTSMVAVNYFLSRGKWKVPFDPDETFMGKFILSSRRPVTVPTMKIEDLRTPYFRDEELHCTVVELNYIGNDKAMFILPDQGKMKQVEASLKPETMRKWKKSLRPRMIDELYLPKFSVSKNYRLESILPELGIRELFSTQADLSGITGDKDVRVYKIVHNAVLDVAETGTEAAATTRCKIVPLSAKFDSVKVVPKAVLDVAETGTEAAAATRFKIVPPSAKLDSVKVIFSRPFLIIIASSNTQIPLLITKVLNSKGD